MPVSPAKRKSTTATSSTGGSTKAQMQMKAGSSASTTSATTSSTSATKKPLKPLISMARPPKFNFGGTNASPTSPASSLSKGKEKASPRQVVDLTVDGEEEEDDNALEGDRLWVDRYEPQTEADLAVHKRKVENVRQWFQEALHGGVSGKLRKYRRILVLTGPAGTAKTTTVRVLAREMGFQICEWSNAQEERIIDSAGAGEYEREGLTQKFDAFLSRAASSIPLMSSSVSYTSSQSLMSSRGSIPSTLSSSSILRHSDRDPKPQVILLEDLPNVLHAPTQEAFHNALTSYVNASSNSPLSAPLVIIISDASVRAEARDERILSGGEGRGRDTIDVRSVIPPGLLGGPYVTQISFNPIAPTLMTRALSELLDRHYGSSSCSSNITRPAKSQIELIVETSNGDIRSAVMALEFACSFTRSQSPSNKSASRVKSGKKRKAGAGSRRLFESVTRREASLHLFHLLGKVLYNKRKGDDPSSSSTAKDKAREAELDRALKSPRPLPVWLESEHGRRVSRVDVDALYADSPIDSGLFGLYIHQNYPQYCDGLEQVDQLSEWLSAIDASGGEHWYQANPHSFHLLALSTLHSLPSPVPRRNQKMYKPEYFESLKKTRGAEDALGDVWMWFQSRVGSGEGGGGRHGKSEIVLEMGKMLGLMGKVGGNQNQGGLPVHTAFSSLVFSRSSDLSGVKLEEDDDADQDDDKGEGDEDMAKIRATGTAVDGETEREGAYLSDDDIEGF